MPVAAAYYPWWSVYNYPPENLDYSKFDILFFAFAIPNDSNGIDLEAEAIPVLQRLVKNARESAKETKIVLSIGGGSGSHWFSQAMSASNRGAFVDATINIMNSYGLDGVDIDWEHPNELGNPHSPDDAENLLAFFKTLRSSLGSLKIIAAAVLCVPWNGPNGSPLTDVAAYADPLTYLNIMNYDTWGGASPTPGPNAPLGNACGTSQRPQLSAKAAYSQWTAAGLPASKLLLGLPMYGYVYKSTATTLTDFAIAPVEAKDERVMGLPAKTSVMVCPPVHKPHEKYECTQDEWIKDVPAGSVKDLKSLADGDLSGSWGDAIAFNQLVALGALQRSGTIYVPINGYTQGWDTCSDTPFIYDVARQTVVAYDDTRSLGIKATFAVQSGMAGCFTWSLNQDDGYTLQNTVLSALERN